jgi:hypothetical protein
MWRGWCAPTRRRLHGPDRPVVLSATSTAPESLLVQDVMIMLVVIPEGPVEGVGSCPLGPPSAVHLHQAGRWSTRALRPGCR